MPAELDRCVKELMKKGKTKEQAFRICRAKLGTDKQIRRKKKK